MAQYKVLTLKDAQLWHDKLMSLPIEQQDVYYSPEYYSLYQNYGDGEARCFIFEDDEKLLLYPFLINSINKLGYNLNRDYFDIQGAYGYNGIVTSSRDKEFIASFHKTFDLYCQETNIIAEFSRFNPILENVALSSPLMQIINSRKTVKLNLKLDVEDIWMNQLNTKNRNVIRKAEKEGVVIVESDDYETFRKLYNDTMENVSAEDYYFFPKAYFEEYSQTFKDQSLLCFAMLGGVPIAGSMFMFSNNYAHYHLSARNKRYYKIAANNLVLWYAIKKAKERGCEWFHFGGGTTGADDDMLLHFKQNFSKEKCDFWIGKRIHNMNVYDIVVSQWIENHYESYKSNINKLLGYREI